MEMSAEEEASNSKVSHKLPFLCHSCNTQFASASALFSHAETCQELSGASNLQEERCVYDNRPLDEVEEMNPIPEEIQDPPDTSMEAEELVVPEQANEIEKVDVTPFLHNDIDKEEFIINSSLEKPNCQVATVTHNHSDSNGLAEEIMDSLNDLTASVDNPNIMVQSTELNAALLDESSYWMKPKLTDKSVLVNEEIKVDSTADTITPTLSGSEPMDQSEMVGQSLDENTSEELTAEVLLQDFDTNIPLECAEYAVKHGKHAAQLEYLKRYPNMKISWERLTIWINTHGLTKQYSGSKHHSRKPRPELPTEIMEECVEYAMANSNENAQIKFTLRYPEHTFMPHLIRQWVWDTKQGKSLGRKSPVQVKIEDPDVKTEKLDFVFPAAFINLVKNRIDVTKDISNEDLLQQIQMLIKEHNTDANNQDQIDEGMDPKVLLSLKDVSAKFNCKGCKSMYRTQEELTKHKVKCWVPDFDEFGLTRSQRACRTKLIKDELQDSESESEIMQTMDLPSSFQSKGEIEDDLRWPCDACTEAFSTKSRWYHHRQKVHKIFAKKPGGHGVEKRTPIESIVQGSRNKRLSPARSRTEDVSFFNSVQFTCSKCARVHISKAGLSDHLMVSHDIWLNEKMEEISLRCNQCEILCFSYDALINHQKNCTNEPVKILYTTDKLQKNFSNFSDAGRPIIFLCPRCYVRFPSLEVLGNHYIAKTCTRVPRPTDPDYRIPV